MGKQNYIGRKVKGFSFDDGFHGVGYNLEMDKYIGIEGVIISYSSEYLAFKVSFNENQHWCYPSSLIDQYLVAEEQDETELRDQFAMQAMNGILSAQVDKQGNGRITDESEANSIAKESYLIANAMLKARKEVKGE